jgi:uncharacterized protein YebE (UPF0316 family)
VEEEAMSELWGSLHLAGLAVLSVGLWTLRVALTARGRKVAGSITAGLEALVFLLAFSSVLADLHAIERVVGYAVGVGTGTLLGVFLDERLSAGQSEVRIVTPGRELNLVRELHGLGWPVTWTRGHGPLGEVTVAFVAVDDTRLARFLKDLQARAPDEFWTVERLRSARAVRQHEGWMQIRRGFGLPGGLASSGQKRQSPTPTAPQQESRFLPRRLRGECRCQASDSNPKAHPAATTVSYSGCSPTSQPTSCCHLNRRPAGSVGRLRGRPRSKTA